MSWVTILWSVDAAVCWSFGAMFLLVWLHQRKNLPYLLFAITAFGVGTFAWFELALMRAPNPETYANLIRWIHVPVWIVMVSLVCFVRLYLNAGRIWLAWSIIVTRTAALIVNFVVTPNLNFREITGLQYQIWFGGEQVAMAMGRPSPWTLIGQFSLLLFSIYVVDATLTAWRRGEHRQAWIVGGSLILFVMLAWLQTAIILLGIVRIPFIIGVPFLGLLVVMAYQLSTDLLRAAKTSAALQESQQRILLAAEASHLALWTWEIPEDMIWVTEEGRPLYGVSRDEKINWDRFLSTVVPDDRGSVQQALDAAMTGSGKYSAEYRVQLADGSVRWITARGNTEFGAHHQPMRLRGVSLDVTERKLAELEARQHRDELTHLSRVTMLGELSGSLAHELNQPLTAILSNAQAAQRFLDRNPIDVNELHEILADIVAQDCRAGEVIRRLRLLLKKGEVQRQPLDVNEVVADVMNLVRSDLVNQQVAADVELAPNLPSVLGDRVQLQQVLLNLVLNACDAMADVDSTRRRLTLATQAASGRQVAVEVRDAGHGIPADQISRVFDPFFTTKSAGLGLGLSVCRTIVQAHGGSLEVSSEVRAGSVFRFSLPGSANGDHERA